MTPEQTYLANLRMIEHIASFVARRNHVTADEAAEFTQQVLVWLLEDDYAILRKFEGRSQLSTYLTTVITRLFSQWRVAQWGKWRPSAEAKRLGDKAITLERLLTREGHSFEEVVKILTTPAGSLFTRAELESLYLRLPVRLPRPMMVSDDLLAETVAVDADGPQRVERGEREKAARHCAATIDELLTSMDDEDRLILKMRFCQALKVADIAKRLNIDQRKLYKRLEKLFMALRRGLERAGVSKADMEKLLAPGDQELRLDLFHDGENPTSGPSHPAGGKRVRGSRGVL